MAAVFIAFMFLCHIVPSKGWTKVEYDATQLMVKTADEISELVRKKIKKAQEIQSKQEDNDDSNFTPEPEAVEQLKDAMRIVLARPDQDGTRTNAFSRLRRELVDLNSLDKVLEDLTTEAIASLRNDKTAPGRANTYIILLENMMAELKPEMNSNAKFKRIIESIRDANLKVTDKLKSQQLIRAMNVPVSPSDTAAKILGKGTPAKK